MKKIFAIMGLCMVASANAFAWEGTAVNVLHHYNYLAVYFATDPGPQGCSVGNPYLIEVDDTVASKERVAMVMMALATGMKLGGYDDGCSTGIWAQSRPKIARLHLAAN